MDIDRLKELKGITEQLYQDGNVPLTYCDDVLELIDEAIARQSVTSEDVDMVIKLMRAYGKNIANRCQIEGTIFYDTGSPCTRHRFGEYTIDIIITALQAYQPNISKTENVGCWYCKGKAYNAPYNYCPKCGRDLKGEGK